MSKAELLEQILALPVEDREHICDALEANLSHEMPPQLSPSDQKMLLKRIEKNKKHPERMLTWKQVKSQLEEQRAKQGAKRQRKPRAGR